MNVRRCVTAAMLLGILLAGLAVGQQMDTALIVGTVSDQTLAVVPGANITFAHLATGTEYTSTTNETGNYRSPPLRIGEYIVVAEAEGFKQYAGSGINLSIGDVRELDIPLEVGAVTEVIEVQASAPLLQTSDASAGTVIANRQIVDLPLNGRDYLQLAVISSGTVRSRGQGISIGGQRGSEVNFTIDGMDNNNQSIASQGGMKETVKPSIDAIAEFKVITNGFSAEYGKTSSGIVALSIKSGTNQVHGTVFEFLRNEKLDAKNFFTPAGGTKPPFKRNQYGLAIGGPIAKNRSFLFGDMEFTRQRESNIRVNNIPTPAFRAGDFSAGDTVYDPMTFDGTERQPFANNQIPASRIDPITDQINDWYPDPQNANRTRNFIFPAPQNRDARKWDLRFDQNLTDTDNFFVRWTSHQRTNLGSPFLPATQFGSLTFGGDVDFTANNAVVAYNKVWSPSLISGFRLGWNYLDTDNTVYGDVTDELNSVIGLQGVDQTLPGAGQFAIAGFRQVGTSNFRPNLIQSQTRQFSADNTWTTGDHAIKFGAQIFWMQSFIQNPQRAKGTFTFDGRFTERSPSMRAGTGESFADFLLGFPREMQGSNTVYMNIRSPVNHYYIQDDWKVSDKLTLNMGLRYERYPPWIETRDGISNFELGTCRGCDDGSINTAGSQGSDRRSRALVDQDNTNFAPRFGVAYRLREKTVIRAAYGIFYATFTNTGGGEFMETMPPFHFKVSLATGRTDPTLSMREGLPAGTITPLGARGVEMSSFQTDLQWPLAQNWNINIQQTLPGDVLWEVGYYGNKMNHMVLRYDENQPLPGPGALNPRRPWSRTTFDAFCRGDVCFDGTEGNDITLGRMNRHAYRGNTLYHGFETKFIKRYSEGFTFIGSYAWSHVIGDNTPLGGSGSAPGESGRVILNVLDWKQERGSSAQDMRQRFVGSFVYELPFGKGKSYGSNWGGVADAVLGGWSVGSIVQLYAGTPQHLTVRGNPAGVGGGDRPNVVSGQRGILSEGRTLDRFFNTDAFVAAPSFTFGDAGKNLLNGPGTTLWDFSLFKNFRISERVRIQYRFESFNFTNTPRFGFPNSQVGNASFGQINGVTDEGGWRRMQMGLKVVF